MEVLHFLSLLQQYHYFSKCDRETHSVVKRFVKLFLSILLHTLRTFLRTFLGTFQVLHFVELCVYSAFMCYFKLLCLLFPSKETLLICHITQGFFISPLPFMGQRIHMDSLTSDNYI